MLQCAHVYCGSRSQIAMGCVPICLMNIHICLHSQLGRSAYASHNLFDACKVALCTLLKVFAQVLHALLLHHDGRISHIRSASLGFHMYFRHNPRSVHVGHYQTPRDCPTGFDFQSCLAFTVPADRSRAAAMTTLFTGVCVLCLCAVTSRGQLPLDSPQISRPVSARQDQLSAHVGKGARRLQQSALQLSALDPVSATTADLVDDPTGRGHLLVTYSGPSSYLYA